MATPAPPAPQLSAPRAGARQTAKEGAASSTATKTAGPKNQRPAQQEQQQQQQLRQEQQLLLAGLESDGEKSKSRGRRAGASSSKRLNSLRRQLFCGLISTAYSPPLSLSPSSYSLSLSLATTSAGGLLLAQPGEGDDASKEQRQQANQAATAASMEKATTRRQSPILSERNNNNANATVNANANRGKVPLAKQASEDKQSDCCLPLSSLCHYHHHHGQSAQKSSYLAANTAARADSRLTLAAGVGGTQAAPLLPANAGSAGAVVVVDVDAKGTSEQSKSTGAQLAAQRRRSQSDYPSAKEEEEVAACNNLVKMIVDKNTTGANHHYRHSFTEQSRVQHDQHGRQQWRQSTKLIKNTTTSTGGELPLEPLILLGSARCPASGEDVAHNSNQNLQQPKVREMQPPKVGSSDGGCVPKVGSQKISSSQSKATSKDHHHHHHRHHHKQQQQQSGHEQQQSAIDQLVELLNQYARQAKQQQLQSSVMERTAKLVAHSSESSANNNNDNNSASNTSSFNTSLEIAQSQQQQQQHWQPSSADEFIGAAQDSDLLYLETNWSSFVQLPPAKTLVASGEQQQAAAKEQQETADTNAHKCNNNDAYEDDNGDDAARQQRRANLRFQQDAIWELLTTEAFYIRRLRVIIDLFLETLASLQRRDTILVEIDANSIFSNIIEVYEANWRLWLEHLLPMLLEARNSRKPLDPSLMRDAFVRIRSLFSPYYRYCIEHTACLRYVRELSRTNQLFKVYVAWCESQKDCERLKLMDLLARPMQRLTRYSLLLKAIAKRTDNPEQFCALEQMTAHMDKFVLTVDLELRRKDDLERLLATTNRIDSFESGCGDFYSDEVDRFARNYGHFDLLRPLFDCPFECHRQLLYDSGSATQLPVAGLPSASQPLGPLKFKDALSGAKQDVVLLLFTDHLLVCKQTSASGAGNLGASATSKWHHHGAGSGGSHSAKAAAPNKSSQQQQHLLHQLNSLACNYAGSPVVQPSTYATGAGSHSLLAHLSPRHCNQQQQQQQWQASLSPRASSQILALAHANSNQDLAQLAASQSDCCNTANAIRSSGSNQRRQSRKHADSAGVAPLPANQFLAASLNLPHSAHSSNSSLAGHAAREFFVRSADNSRSGDNHHSHYHSFYHSHRSSYQQQDNHQLMASTAAAAVAAAASRLSTTESRLRVIRSPYPVERLVMHELKDGQGVFCCQLNDSLTIATSFIVYTCASANSSSGVAASVPLAAFGATSGSGELLLKSSDHNNHLTQHSRSSNYLRAQDSSRSESESLQLGGALGNIIVGAGGNAPAGATTGGGGGSNCSSRRSSDFKRRLSPARQLINLIKQAQVRYQLAANFHNVNLRTLNVNSLVVGSDAEENTNSELQQQQQSAQHQTSHHLRWSSFRHHSRGNSEKGVAAKSATAAVGVTGVAPAPNKPVKQLSNENNNNNNNNNNNGNNNNWAAVNGPAIANADASSNGCHRPWSEERRSVSSENNQMPGSTSAADQQQQLGNSPSKQGHLLQQQLTSSSSPLLKAIIEQHQSMLLNHGLHDELSTNDYLYPMLDESYLRVVPVAVGLMHSNSESAVDASQSNHHAKQSNQQLQQQQRQPNSAHESIMEPVDLNHLSPKSSFTVEQTIAVVANANLVELNKVEQTCSLVTAAAATISNSVTSTSSNSSATTRSSSPYARPTADRLRAKGLSSHWRSPSTRRRGWHLAEAQQVSISASNIHDILPAHHSHQAAQVEPLSLSAQQQQQASAAAAALASDNEMNSRDSASSASQFQMKKRSRRNLSSLKRQNVILSASSEQQAQQLQLQLPEPLSTNRGQTMAPTTATATGGAGIETAVGKRQQQQQPCLTSPTSRLSRRGSSADTTATTTTTTTTGPSVSSSVPVSSALESQQRHLNQHHLISQRQGSSQATTMDQMSITLDDSNFDLLLLAEVQPSQQHLQQCHFATSIGPKGGAAMAPSCDSPGARAISFELGNLRHNRAGSLAAYEKTMAARAIKTNARTGGLCGVARDEAHARSASMETRPPISVTLTLPNNDDERHQTRLQCQRECLEAASIFGPTQDIWLEQQQLQLAGCETQIGCQTYLSIPRKGAPKQAQTNEEDDSHSLPASFVRRSSLTPINLSSTSPNYNDRQLRDDYTGAQLAQSPSGSSYSRVSSADSHQPHDYSALAGTRRIERQIGTDHLPVFNVTAASPLDLNDGCCERAYGDNEEDYNINIGEDEDDDDDDDADDDDNESFRYVEQFERASQTTAHSQFVTNACWPTRTRSSGAGQCDSLHVRCARSVNELADCSPSELAASGEANVYVSGCGGVSSTTTAAAESEDSSVTLFRKCQTFLKSKRRREQKKHRNNSERGTTTTTAKATTFAAGKLAQVTGGKGKGTATSAAIELGFSKSAENIVRASQTAGSLIVVSSTRTTNGANQSSQQQRVQRRRRRELSAGATVAAGAVLSDLDNGDDDDDDDDLLEFGDNLIDVNCINSLMRERRAACSPCEDNCEDKSVAGYLGFHEKLDLHNRRLVEAEEKAAAAKAGAKRLPAMPVTFATATPGAASGSSATLGRVKSQGQSGTEQQVSAARSAFSWLAGSRQGATSPARGASNSSTKANAFLTKSPRHSSSTNSSSGSRSSRALNLTRSMTGEIFDTFLRAASLRSVSSGKANL